MARIKPQEYDQVNQQVKSIWDQQARDHGRMTNMKKTLAHCYESLHALMEWYPLFNKVKEFISEDSAIIFVAAISVQTDCLICSTFFRRIMIENGKDPDQFQPSEKEQLLIDYGRQLVNNSHGVDEQLYQRLNAFFTDEQIVTLTSFAGMMIATNVFNNALKVDLDSYLYPYREKSKTAE